MSVVMHFYVTRTSDGLLHVQNILAGMSGQHHVHTEAGYDVWREGLSDEVLHVSEGECDCGLAAGDVRDHGGRVWHNPKFAV